MKPLQLEIKIIKGFKDSSRSGLVIGFTTTGDISLPGMSQNTSAYVCVGNNGFIRQDSQQLKNAPAIYEGDVVGCSIWKTQLNDTNITSYIITNNGKIIGERRYLESSILYPTIRGFGLEIETNFGEEQFQFPIGNFLFHLTIYLRYGIIEMFTFP